MRRILTVLALLMLALSTITSAHATIYQRLPCGGTKINGGCGHYHSCVRWYYQESYWVTRYRTECVGIINGRAQYANVPYRYFVPGYWYPVEEYVWVPDACW